MAQKHLYSIVLIHLYWLIKVTSYQVFKLQGRFATESIHGNENAKILYNKTLTSDLQCALLCLQKSEKCAGYLHDSVDCLLVAAGCATPVSMAEIGHLKGFTFYREFEEITCGKYRLRVGVHVLSGKLHTCRLSSDLHVSDTPLINFTYLY